MKREPLVKGQRYGKLIALQSSGEGYEKWDFQCDCGVIKMLRRSDVRSGKTTSCGCFRKEHFSRLYKGKGKHGIFWRTPTGQSWSAMIQRCYNKKCASYSAYGAIGITVCESLRASVLNLVDLIGEKPKDLSIDRIDNLDGYHCGKCSECFEKSWKMNVRWATDEQQQRNKSNNRLFTINGETKCVMEWAELYGINRDTMWWRVKNGKTGVDLIATPR